MRARHAEESEFTTALTKVRLLASESRAGRASPAFLDVGPLRPPAEPRATELEVTRRDVVVRLRLPVSPRQLKGTTSGLSLRIDDPDAHYARTKAAGGKITRDLQNEDYGSRGYMAEDPEGHRWYFGTYRPGAHWKQ